MAVNNSTQSTQDDICAAAIARLNVKYPGKPIAFIHGVPGVWIAEDEEAPIVQ